MAAEGWIDAAWATVSRGMSVSAFLQSVVRVFAVLVAIGLALITIAAGAADDDNARAILLVSAVAGFFFWSIFLGAVYALATLLEVQTMSLEALLLDDESDENDENESLAPASS
jgi:hypothetical protein